GDASFTAGPRVALVQGNLSTQIRNMVGTGEKTHLPLTAVQAITPLSVPGVFSAITHALIMNEFYDGLAEESVPRMVFNHYANLTWPAAIHNPDLIAWPETSYPFEHVDVVPGLARSKLPWEWQDILAENDAKRARKIRWPTNVLLGLNSSII